MPGARGEAIIQAGDREVRILLTIRALVEAEKQSGKGLSAILSKEGFGIQETAILLCAGMEAARRDARLGGPRITINDAYDVLTEVGWQAASEAVLLAVTGAISPNEAEDPNL